MQTTIQQPGAQHTPHERDERFKRMARSVGHSLITWEWTKRLLYWLIISAGTMSELAFLIASLWISINSSVHTFVLIFMPVGINENVTYLATTAYVALPELVLGLAFVTVIGHVKMFILKRVRAIFALLGR